MEVGEVAVGCGVVFQSPIYSGNLRSIPFNAKGSIVIQINRLDNHGLLFFCRRQSMLVSIHRVAVQAKDIVDRCVFARDDLEDILAKLAADDGRYGADLGSRACCD